jgi:SAM-dependent methyltransferase
VDGDPHHARDPVSAWYDAHDERSRLGYGEGRVEFLRTKELLQPALPSSPARVLDVGGADGAHASWLTDDGHAVEVVDVVPLHVERARARGFVAHVGDARALSYDDNSFDVVLLLGPLYHLRDRAERMQALGEAHRVLRPNGLVAAAAVTRTAVALNWLRSGALEAADSKKVVERITAVGYDDTGSGEGVFYFHTAAEFERELHDAGFGRVAIRGVEGPAWPLLDPHCPPEHPLVSQVIGVARLADADDSTVGASAHLLALARP